MSIWKQARSTQMGGPWLTYADPAEAGWSAEKLQEAKQVFDEIGSAALLIVDRGAVAAAWGNVTVPYRCHSLRKSLLSALYGIHTKLSNIDINRTLSELRIDDAPPLTEQERQAKVVHLLKARSGIYHEAASETAAMKNNRPARGSHAPDTFWYYNNWDFNALESIFERAVDSTVFEEFEQRLAIPLHMEDFSPALHTQMVKQGQFSIHGARHYRLSARDLARFGLLYLQGGRFGDQQLIPDDWIRESTSPHSIMEPLGAGYGYLWWIPLDAKWRELGMYEARGVGGQCVTILPKEDLVIVHRADTDSGRHVNGRQVLRLYQLILEAKAGAPAIQAPPELIPLEMDTGEMQFMLHHYRSFHLKARALEMIEEKHWLEPLSASNSSSPKDLLVRIVHRDAIALDILQSQIPPAETAAEWEQASRLSSADVSRLWLRRYMEQRERLYSILQRLSTQDWERTYLWNGREISVKTYFLTNVLLDYQLSEPLLRFFQAHKDAEAH
ncbi:serine hydrolase domain-containing protein [Paenibacillus sp. OAS669]|uniref:serine hydrolase domain-containing protein n=1 Tax=Paenibacillus sp. OAS669 TaxID=2663821 RepID=UPI001788FE31|nr:serine hydrolase [Paenibacillus sp. OAS669]MBE1446705.1 hypothetical protein [Paenibacillus sp. OAS669]